MQLERPGLNYAALAGDAVVGLASLSVTLESRRRLAVNGTVESVGRLLARAMAGDAEGWRQGREGDYEAVRNLVRHDFVYLASTSPARGADFGSGTHFARARVVFRIYGGKEHSGPNSKTVNTQLFLP